AIDGDGAGGGEAHQADAGRPAGGVHAVERDAGAADGDGVEIQARYRRAGGDVRRAGDVDRTASGGAEAGAGGRRDPQRAGEGDDRAVVRSEGDGGVCGRAQRLRAGERDRGAGDARVHLHAGAVVGDRRADVRDRRRAEAREVDAALAGVGRDRIRVVHHEV